MLIDIFKELYCLQCYQLHRVMIVQNHMCKQLKFSGPYHFHGSNMLADLHR